MSKVENLALLLLLIVSFATQATCVRVTATNQLSASAISAGYTAKNWTGSCDTCNGNLGLPSVVSVNSGSNFQPQGTVLASSTASFLTAAQNTAYTSNQILFKCALSDASSIYEMYATNGDSVWAGQNAVSGLDGVYYSQVYKIGVRITNTATGEYYTRAWKQRKITSSSWYQDSSYIYIPASAFSNVKYELIKIDSTTYYGNASQYFSDGLAQPHGYIAFKGTGLSTNVVAGGDSGSLYGGFYDAWPAAWGTYGKVTYVRGALCEVLDYTSTVILPTITVAALKSGATSQMPFSVSLNCETAATSGTSVSSTSTQNVALGFLVNNSTAVAAAKNLNLVTSGGGLTWLLDNAYGSDGVATGVGIKIYNSNGSAINLLPDRTSTGTGNTRGWYAYKDLLALASSGTTNVYKGNFTASLEAISGQSITPGTVNAQLQVVVSFQ